MMNKYRVIYDSEECTQYKCITCKEDFIGSGLPLNFCSACGVKLDCLEKKNERWGYRIKPKTPVLRLEYLYYDDGMRSGEAWGSYRYTKPEPPTWRLLGHYRWCDIWDGEKKTKDRLLADIRKRKSKLRLITVDGDQERVIKTYG